MSIKISIECDICKTGDLYATTTNLPRGGKIDVPFIQGDVWHVTLREGDGGHREVHWHLCSQECLARWAEEQHHSRMTPEQRKEREELRTNAARSK